MKVVSSRVVVAGGRARAPLRAGTKKGGRRGRPFASFATRAVQAARLRPRAPGAPSRGMKLLITSGGSEEPIDAVRFELRCFVKNVDYRLIVESDLRYAIDDAFRAEKIEIPFPQRVGYMQQPSVKAPESS